MARADVSSQRNLMLGQWAARAARDHLLYAWRGAAGAILRGIVPTEWNQECDASETPIRMAGPQARHARMGPPASDVYGSQGRVRNARNWEHRPQSRSWSATSARAAYPSAAPQAQRACPGRVYRPGAGSHRELRRAAGAIRWASAEQEQVYNTRESGVQDSRTAIAGPLTGATTLGRAAYDTAEPRP